MSTSLGSNIGQRTLVRPLPSAGSLFPVVSRHLWKSARMSELVSNDDYVAIQGLQAPSGATDYTYLEPGKYSIKHDTSGGMSRLRITSQTPGSSPCYILASDRKQNDVAYFTVTQLSLPASANMHSLVTDSEAILEVVENGGFAVRRGPGETEWCYRIDGTGGKKKLSKCLRTYT